MKDAARQAGIAQNMREQGCHSTASRPWLPGHGVSCGKGLQSLNTRKKERKVRRADHEHMTQRVTVHFSLHPGEPKWPALVAESAWAQDLLRAAFEKAHGFQQRQQLRRQSVRKTAV